MEEYSEPLLSENIVIQDFEVHRESMYTHEEANQASPISEIEELGKVEISPATKTLAGSIRQDSLKKNSCVKFGSTECSIYRVPKLLREGKENAYTPMVVSIGPYHRIVDNSDSIMESYKRACLESFLANKPENLLELCVEKIRKAESRIRESYSDPIGLKSDDFTRMVLFDSVFIIEFLSERDKPAFERVRCDEIRRDLLLLENQLPFFIVNEIYKIAYAQEFKIVVAKFYTISSDLIDWDNTYHLLHLVRQNYVEKFFYGFDNKKKTVECKKSQSPTTAIIIHNDDNEKESLQYILSPTATRLHAAGVKFQVVDINLQSVDSNELHEDVSNEKEDETGQNGDKQSPLHLNFDKENCTLRIPKIVTEDSAQSLIRNMIALEQCMCRFNRATYITDYCYFLDCLINTPQDVQLLADAGVVENWMGCEVVCDMFNAINSNTRIVPSEYLCRGLSVELNKHCNKDWNCYIAMLKNKYFSHPWAVLSLLFAIFLMLLSVAQVVIGVLAIP